jgi:hypothetical protein
MVQQQLGVVTIVAGPSSLEDGSGTVQRQHRKSSSTWMKSSGLQSDSAPSRSVVLGFYGVYTHEETLAYNVRLDTLFIWHCSDLGPQPLIGYAFDHDAWVRNPLTKLWKLFI